MNMVQKAGDLAKTFGKCVMGGLAAVAFTAATAVAGAPEMSKRPEMRTSPIQKAIMEVAVDGITKDVNSSMASVPKPKI